MIVGIGTDIIEISRFDKIKENEIFIKKNYTLTEIDYFNSLNKKSETLAGAFCVKEAVAKALGTGFVNFTPADIEVIHDTAGQPHVKVCGKASEQADKIGVKKFHVSISHSKLVACAFVVAEG